MADEKLAKEVLLGIDLASWKSPMYEDSYFEPYNPDDLVRKFGGNGKGLDKYKKMKQDDAVKSALFVKKSAVVSSGWTIKAASDEPADKEIADQIQDQLLHTFEDNFDASLMQVLSAIEYGFSVMEKIYAVEDGKVVLKKLKAKPPQSFEFHTDNFGNLKPGGFQQWTAQGGRISLPLYKFIYYVHNRELDNWYGDSDLRAAYRSWFSKDIIIKAWNIYLERCGVPLVVATHDKNMSSDERTDLQSVIENLSFKTSLLIPEGSGVEFKESTRQATGDFAAAVDKHNQMIMRSILVPRHLGFDEAAGGSYALGKVNFDVFAWVVNRLRGELEDVVNEQLIRQMVTLNYPGVKQFPLFAFNPLTEDDSDAAAKNIIEALKGGAVTPDVETENYLRGLLGLPEITEATITDRKPAPLPAKAQDEGKDEPDDEGQGDDIDGDDKPGKGGKYAYKRPMTNYEKKVDFSLVKEALIDDVEIGIGEIKDQLRKIRDDFTNQVVRKKVIEDKNVAAVNDLEFRYLRDLALIFEDVLRTGYDKGKKSAKKTAGKADYAAKKPISGAGLPPGKGILWVKAQAKILTGEIGTKLQSQAKKIILDGMEKGLPVYDVVNKLDAIFEPYVAEAGVEGSAIEGMSLYTEVNTTISKAYRTGLDEFNRDLEAEGYIQAYQYSAIIDDVTTPECEELDQMIFGVNNPVWDRANPPIWWNCRSTRVPIFQGEEWVEDDVPAIVYSSKQVFNYAGTDN